MATNLAIKQEAAEMYATGLFSCRELGERFGVSGKTVKAWTAGVVKGSQKSNFTKASAADLILRLQRLKMKTDAHLQAYIDALKADKPIVFQGKIKGYEPDWQARLRAARDISELLEDTAAGQAAKKLNGPAVQVNITVESLIRELDTPGNQAVKADWSIG